MSVTLEQVTASTLRRILALEVAENQRHLVASNAVSVAEAHFNPGAWFRAVYSGGTPVGFVMLFDPTAPGATSEWPLEPAEIGLWRLMIDRSHQGRGYGRATLDRIVEHIRSNTRATRLLATLVPGDGGPQDFYLQYGFRRTGRAHDGEVEIALDL